ncbi:hypothetical protein BT69DRAFT_1278298 [Atractiella rhizophila]|nr:hypothetical protein BT69DRAFT_1278298 [Atractiella rhizophila]
MVLPSPSLNNATVNAQRVQIVLRSSRLTTKMLVHLFDKAAPAPTITGNICNSIFCFHLSSF